MKTLLGKKIGMTQIFAEDGTVIPVTVVEAGPVTVVQVKTVENDGYDAVQVGFEDQKPQRVNKPMSGHFAKAGVDTKKYLAEFKPGEGEAYEVGQVITVADFEEGMKLDVTGTSKGKGTQGNIKRHGHRRGPMTAPGRMGRDKVTVQNVVLVKKLDDRNIMMIKGAVPGKKGGLLRIRPAVKGQDK